jgi:uncharacterized protein
MSDSTSPTELDLPVPLPGGETITVSGLLLRPTGARAILVLGHGAGAGMRHRFMERVAAELAARDVATLRYQFPYMEAGRKRTDTPAVATATVRAAIATAREAAPELPRLAGGKSFGGRMTSRAVADGLIRCQPAHSRAVHGAPADDGPPADDDPPANHDPAAVRGLVLFGFPLHPAGRPGTDRADHLRQVPCPLLFLQGTRDSLAELDLLRPVVAGLGDRATLHVVEGGDHSFGVLKRSGRSEDEVMAELGDVTAGWITEQANARGQPTARPRPGRR